MTDCESLRGCSARLKASALRFLNADVIAGELQIGAAESARIVTAMRHELVKQRESFVLETVFSDPVGGKLAFLKQAPWSGAGARTRGLSRPWLNRSTSGRS